jgi:hypothetical protein
MARVSGRRVIRAVAAAAVTWSSTVRADEPPTPTGGGPLTVLVELLVSDAKGRPVADLKASELEVFQEGAPQRVTLTALPGAGRYQITYVPRSGRAARVSVRVTRPGVRVRGPDGPFLTPRVVPGLSTFEADLAALLKTSPEPNQVPYGVSVLTFEAREDGVHHTLAVEVPLSGLRCEPRAGALHGRLHLFARIVGPDGLQVQRYSLDRAVEAVSENQAVAERLVWTGHAHLAPGPYILETVVRDAVASRSGVRRVPFTAPEVRPGLRLSSVTLLQPRGTLLRGDQPVDDDPLYFHQEPLLPTLDLALPSGVEAKVRFFVVAYPDPARREPVELSAELWRDGSLVGGTKIPLPSPDAQGRIPYVGGMPTRKLSLGAYGFRLVARQAEAVAAEETKFQIVPEGDPRLRFTDR